MLISITIHDDSSLPSAFSIWGRCCHIDIRILHEGGCTLHETYRALGRNAHIKACALPRRTFEVNSVCTHDNRTYDNPFVGKCTFSGCFVELARWRLAKLIADTYIMLICFYFEWIPAPPPCSYMCQRADCNARKSRRNMWMSGATELWKSAAHARITKNGHAIRTVALFGLRQWFAYISIRASFRMFTAVQSMYV